MNAVRAMLRRVVSAAHVVLGMPDYRRYVAHVRRMHPGTEPMDYATFFRERQAARYGASATRCC